ncbi:MAG: hypothetical protein PWP23_2573 [Candidatus Sumerlaeota bacterium]|nr:hypothetical protein [Candidatus Sumerlaeota bacterium]
MNHKPRTTKPRARFALAALAFGQLAPAQPIAAEPEAPPRWEVTLPALPLTLNEVEGRFIVGLGLNGLAWVDSTPGKTGEPPVLNTAAYQTLGTLEVEDGGVLLAGRDSTLRLLRFLPGEEQPHLVFEVPAEGIPSGLALRGNVLAVASGGAGVGIWNWPEGDEPPRLVGRYPFVDYAKETAFYDETTLLVSDAHNAGLWVLDVSDPRRPHRRQHLPAYSFADSAATDGTYAAFTDRAFGTWIARRPGPAETPFEVTQQIPIIPPPQDQYHVERTRFDARTGTLLVIEGWGGVRCWQPGPNGWESTGTYAGGEQVMDAVLLEDGRLATISGNNRLTVRPIEE